MQNIAQSTSQVTDPRFSLLSFADLQALLAGNDSASSAPRQTAGQAGSGLYNSAVWLAPVMANDPHDDDPIDDDMDDDDADDSDELDTDFPDELPDTGNPQTDPQRPREMRL